MASNLADASRSAPEIRRGHGWLFLLVASLIAAGCAAYWQSYSSFARYDDEGYIQLSLHLYQEQGVLYDEIATQYGPAYFVVQDLLHRATGLPLSHDSARAKTVIVWLLAALLMAGITWRLTSQRLLAMLIGLGTMWHVDRLGLEPGHPQDLAILILLVSLWLATRWSESGARRRLGLIVCWGVGLGTLAMLKINLALFSGIACLGALLLETPTNRFKHWCWYGLVVGGSLLPLVLSGKHLLSWDGVRLPLAVMAGWIGLALIEASSFRRRNRSLVTDIPSRTSNTLLRLWGPIVVLAVVTLGTAATYAIVALQRGTTMAGLWHGLVGQHRGFLDLFYHAAPLPVWSLPISVAGIGLAILVRWKPPIVEHVQWAALGLLGYVGLTVFGETFQPFYHGLDDRSGAALLAACVPPFAWVLLAQSGHELPHCFARRLIALLAIVQPLGAIPTPGTQLAIATLPALLVLVILIGDRLQELPTSLPAMIPPVQTALRGLVLLSVGTLICRDVQAWRQWSAAEPLNLPGARWLRLPPEEAADRRRIVTYLQNHSDVFVASPTGCCSFYLWSGIAPPTSRNTTFWEVLLTPADQQRVIEILERAQQPRLIVDHGQAPVIHRNAPLFQYLEQRFTQCEVEGRLEIRAPAPVQQARWSAAPNR